MKSLLIAVLLLSTAMLFSHAKVLLEINFDLALQQESATGYTAAHTVGEYLEDSNLLTLRYYHTLVSGQPRQSNIRVAHMEFKDMKGWAQFEGTNLEKSHVLFDLFWINWRRVLWTESAETENLARRSLPEGKNGGYVYTLRYSVKEGKDAEHQKWKDSHSAKCKQALEANPGYVVHHHYSSGLFQDEYQHMFTVEFVDLPALSSSMLEPGVIVDLLTEKREKFLSRWAVTVLVPSADAQGGVIFKGAGSK